jgi:hypothetical protein
LGGLLIPRQNLGSLLPDGVPPVRSDPGPVGKRRLLYACVDRPARHREEPLTVKSRTVHAFVESTVADTPHGDWRLDRRQQSVSPPCANHVLYLARSLPMAIKLKECMAIFIILFS